MLQITGDPVALGIALALQGLPRAALMLLGGAVTDRLSPRRVMLVANVVHGLLAAMMAAAVAGSPVQLWMVYAFSVLVGIASGFAVPAENSIVPQLVRAQDLQAGNSVIMGLTQLAGFVGPSVAGVVIGHYTHSLTGVAVAYTLDAATFAVSAAALAAMRGVRRPTADTSENLLAATASGLRFLWGDGVLRTLFAVLLAVNLLLMGPLMVGIPQLAHERLPEGAAAFGILMSAFAVGNLAGYLVAGALPRPDGRRLRQVVIALVVAFGGGIGSLGVVPSTWVDAGVLATLGLGNGFMAVLMVTWIQARTPSAMVGRMMSLMTPASTGLVPASEALAGVVGARRPHDAVRRPGGGGTHSWSRARVPPEPHSTGRGARHPRAARRGRGGRSHPRRAPHRDRSRRMTCPQGWAGPRRLHPCRGCISKVPSRVGGS